MQGKLILVVGPSGSGKGTLMAHIRNTFPHIPSPTTWTTRAPRPGEENGQSGKKYHFVSQEEFSNNIETGGFIEWAEYGGNRYGTPLAEVMNPLSRGETVLQELEIQGVEQLRQRIPKEQLAVIFIDAGSWDELRRRILARGPMDEEELEKRRVRYEHEQTFAATADFIIKNPFGKVEDAKREIEKTIRVLSARSVSV